MTELICWDRKELEARGYRLVTELHVPEGQPAPGHGKIFKIARERNLRMDTLTAWRLRPDWWGVFEGKR